MYRDLQDYYLHWYHPRPVGITPARQEELRRAGFSASAGDAAPQMAAEEGRGVFLLTARMEVAR